MVTIVKANIKLYKNSRKTPFISGYRPIFSFENQEMRTSGKIDLIDREQFCPGEEGDVQIRFLSKFIEENFRTGISFIFSEGAVPLGEGTVKEIL